MTEYQRWLENRRTWGWPEWYVKAVWDDAHRPKTVRPHANGKPKGW